MAASHDALSALVKTIVAGQVTPPVAAQVHGRAEAIIRDAEDISEEIRAKVEATQELECLQPEEVRTLLRKKCERALARLNALQDKDAPPHRHDRCVVKAARAALDFCSVLGVVDHRSLPVLGELSAERPEEARVVVLHKRDGEHMRPDGAQARAFYEVTISADRLCLRVRRASETRPDQTRFFEHLLDRPLTAQQFADAIARGDSHMTRGFLHSVDIRGFVRRGGTVAFEV